MNRNPLFSVLIANYNNGKYLMRAIESVRQQTYTNWEIVLVDDSSTDNSNELYVDLEKDERIHVYRNERNMGCGYTKRRCAELAQGDYCGFLDPDDELFPNAINSMVAVHNANKDVSVVYSRCKEYDIITGQPDGENKLLELNENETYFDYRNYGAMHFTTFKKAFYDKTEGIAAHIKAGVDQDLNFKIEEVGKIYVLNEFTYKYYVNNENSVSSSNKLPELFFWNIYVRYQTCLRRKLPTEEIMHQDIVNYLIECINSGKYNAEVEIHKSMRYRLGNKLISPIQSILRAFRKNN